MLLSPQAFVTELDAQNRQAFERIATVNATPLSPASSAQPEPAAGLPPLTVARLLTLALKNELEATECAAAWIGSTPEVDAKIAFARQAGDEAKHYKLIQRRLRELGVETSDLDPLAQGRTPLLEFLLSLEGTVARVAAGQFTREALAVVRNDEFARFCEASGDPSTAALYNDVIQADEQHHHELGRALLLKYATTEASQAAARAASQRVLELAEELQEAARLKMGVTRAPGC